MGRTHRILCSQITNKNERFLLVLHSKVAEVASRSPSKAPLLRIEHIPQFCRNMPIPPLLRNIAVALPTLLYHSTPQLCRNIVRFPFQNTVVLVVPAAANLFLDLRTDFDSPICQNSSTAPY